MIQLSDAPNISYSITSGETIQPSVGCSSSHADQFANKVRAWLLVEVSWPCRHSSVSVTDFAKTRRCWWPSLPTLGWRIVSLLNVNKACIAAGLTRNLRLRRFSQSENLSSLKETPRPRGKTAAFGSCRHPRHPTLSYLHEELGQRYIRSIYSLVK